MALIDRYKKNKPAVVEKNTNDKPLYAPQYGDYMRTQTRCYAGTTGNTSFMQAESVDDKGLHWQVSTVETTQHHDDPEISGAKTKITPHKEVCSYFEAINALNIFQIATDEMVNISEGQITFSNRPNQLNFTFFRHFAEGEGNVIFDKIGRMTTRRTPDSYPIGEFDQDDIDRANNMYHRRKIGKKVRENKTSIGVDHVSAFAPLECKSMAQIFADLGNANNADDFIRGIENFDALDNFTKAITSFYSNMENISIKETSVNKGTDKHKTPLRKRKTEKEYKWCYEDREFNGYLYNGWEHAVHHLDVAHEEALKLKKNGHDISPMVDFLNRCELAYHTYVAHKIRNAEALSRKEAASNGVTKEHVATILKDLMPKIKHLAEITDMPDNDYTAIEQSIKANNPAVFPEFLKQFLNQYEQFENKIQMTLSGKQETVTATNTTKPAKQFGIK